MNNKITLKKRKHSFCKQMRKTAIKSMDIKFSSFFLRRKIAHRSKWYKRKRAPIQFDLLWLKITLSRIHFSWNERHIQMYKEYTNCIHISFRSEIVFFFLVVFPLAQYVFGVYLECLWNNVTICIFCCCYFYCSCFLCWVC